jgi:hypothetical protein
LTHHKPAPDLIERGGEIDAEVVNSAYARAERKRFGIS